MVRAAGACYWYLLQAKGTLYMLATTRLGAR